MLLTLPLTFALLLIAFAAVVAGIIPLILAVTSVLAAFGILALYSQAVAAVSPYANQLVVLIGLAVAVDYSLFMVTRFRTERRHRGGHRGPAATRGVLARRAILALVAVLAPAAVILGRGSRRSRPRARPRVGPCSSRGSRS